MDNLKRKNHLRRALILIICMALIVCYVPAGTAFGDTGTDTVQEAEAPAPQLEDGTYVPGQVVVMFREGAVSSDDASLKAVKSLPNISRSFGAELNSTGSQDDAAVAARGQSAILANSLGSDFVIEDTLIFPETAEDDSIAHEKLQAKGLTGKSSSARSISKAAVSNGLNVSLVSSDTYTTEEMIEILSEDPRVAIVEPNYVYEFTDYEDYDLNDPYSSYLYNVNTPLAHNTAGDSASWRDPQPEDPADVVSTNAGSAWAKFDGSEEEIVVAVIDSGLNVNHEDLKNMLWENPGDIGLQGEHGYNMGEKNTDLTDNVGHGTHCVGIIAAEANNGLGVAGIASKANLKIMMLKTDAETEESMQLFTAMGSFNYVLRAKQRGVNIVATSNSWGRGDTQSSLFNEIVDRMGEAGILTFTAAGNSNKDLDTAVDNPASNESEFGINVGAAGITGQRAGFSNYGRTYVDIFAPGMNILSTVGYRCYFPNLYTPEKLNVTTEYYGYFPEGSVKEDGNVEPAVPEGADDVKALGAPIFVEQLNPYILPEGEEPEAKATVEYSIDRDHYFTTGEDPTSLKVTIKNAQYGFDYYFFFPYEKNPETTDENTWYSFFYKTGDTPKEYACEVMGGEIILDPETGECSTNGIDIAHGLTPANKYVDTHLFGKLKPMIGSDADTGASDDDYFYAEGLEENEEIPTVNDTEAPVEDETPADTAYDEAIETETVEDEAAEAVAEESDIAADEAIADEAPEEAISEEGDETPEAAEPADAEETAADEGEEAEAPADAVEASDEEEASEAEVGEDVSETPIDEDTSVDETAETEVGDELTEDTENTDEPVSVEDPADPAEGEETEEPAGPEEPSASKDVYGIGIIISPAELAGNKWKEGGTSDLTFYVDSAAVSCLDPLFGRNESYEMMSGTSMACPAAAGALAVIASLYPKTEDQTGAEYAREIKARFYSCAHQTEELKDLCSTGGYVDLSLLEDPNPAITDAVLDSEADTITLYGMGLNEGAEVSYRRIAQDGAEPVTIPSGDMTVSYSDDGGSLVINNARELFGTYTEFTVNYNGRSGSGKFYLVKGLKPLEIVADHYRKNPMEEDYVNEATPHIFANEDGTRLFAIDNRQGTISVFHDDQFIDIKGTVLKDAFAGYMDYDEYQSTNCLNMYITDYRKPLTEGNMIYVPFGYSYDDGVDYENEQMMAVMDISYEKPTWTFRPYIDPVNIDFSTDPESYPDGLYYIFYSNAYEVMGDKLYAVGSPSGTKGGNSALFSFDLKDDAAEWQIEAELPSRIAMPLLAEYNGKLYAMLGAKDVGDDKTFEEMINDKVYCYDGTSWTESGDLKYSGKYSGMHFPEIDKYCAEAADGLVFMDTFVDGAGNFFNYDPEADKITPLDVTINFGNSDDAFFGSSSCAATRDGIYYIRDHSTEMRRGWALWLLPASEFNSKFPAGEMDASTIEGIKIKLSDTSYVYDGKVKTPDVVSVTLDGKVLEEGKDYSVSYADGRKNAGTYKVTVTGIGTYKGTVETSFKITPKEITPKVTLSKASYTWTGKALKPTVTVKDGSTKLASSQYTVTYSPSACKNVGKVSVKVTLKGNYKGTKTVTYKINPKGRSIKSVTAASKALTVNWTKQATKMSTSYISGYQIYVATDSAFTKNVKKMYVEKYSTVSKKVTGLKGSTKYYVKMRTYKTVNGVKYYSPWSAVKTVTTKK